MNIFEEFENQFKKPEEPNYGEMGYLDAKLAYMNLHGDVDNDYFRDKIYQPAKVKAILAKDELPFLNEHGVVTIPTEQQLDEHVKSLNNDGQEALFGESVKTVQALAEAGAKNINAGLKGCLETPMLSKALAQSEPSNEMINLEKAYEMIGEKELPKSVLPTVEFNKNIMNFEIKGAPPEWAKEHAVITTLPPSQTEYIYLQVLGSPTAQKRHQTVRMGSKAMNIGGKNMQVGGFNMNIDPSAGLKADFLAIVQQYAPEKPWEGPIKLDVICYFPRPKSHYRTGKNAHILKEDAPTWHIARPDEDNLRKFVKDALNKVYWRDDSQICTGTTDKFYDDKTPRTEITITKL